MGIDRDAWISVWAGALGAIPAAVISAAVAAWVAVTVLNRSNVYQKKLADEGLASQQQLAERQLAEQRAEAGRAREQAAIAEVLIANEAFLIVSRESVDSVREHLPAFQAAVARWRVELGLVRIGPELEAWTNLLLAAASSRALERLARDDGEDGPSWEVLYRAVGTLSALLLQWSDNEISREALYEEVRERRLRFQGELADIPDAVVVP